MTLLETFLVLTQPWRSVFAQPRTWLRARPMRWLVIVPTPCRIPSSLRFYYRQPAYLLCLDLTRSSRPRLQVYFTVGRSKSIIVKRKAPWSSLRRNCGTPSRFPNSRPWSLPLTAL